MQKNKKLQAIIAPSILAADFANLQAECEQILECKADTLHLDIMDGHFVNNISFGLPVIKSLRQKLPKETYFDCHLMVEYPQKWISEFAKYHVNQFTFHYEANHEGKILDLASEILQNKMDAGLAISPQTKISDQILKLFESDLFNTALIMTVNPGFGGQKFINECLNKVQQLRKHFPNLNIGVDGGIYLDNVTESAKAGANNIISGTGIFQQKDKQQIIASMKNIVNSFLN